MGRVGVVLLALIALLCFLGGWGYSYDENQRDRYNAFIADCTKNKGVVAETRREAYSTRYDCYVNGEVKHLPGWD